MPRPLKLALSILCENPARRTGLTTLFDEFVSHALTLFPDIHWVIFAGPNQPWTIEHERVEVIRRYPANDRLAARLFADHFRVPAAARRAGADALLTVGFAPLRRCLPVVMHLFSLQHLNADNRVGLARRLYRGMAVGRGLRSAELIVTNSRFAASQILASSPECRDRLTVSYEGLQHDQFTPDAPPGEAAFLQEKLGLAPGYLLWVSNFYPYKQSGLLLAAYARLDPAFRARHPLVMVGGNWKGGKDEARTQAEALGIADDVRFPGWVEDAWLAPLYRQARAFVLASREETFGRCVAEAMACGTPCVVNDLPIMQEVTGGHALIVDFQDPAAVAQALQTVFTDETLRTRLRTDGIAWVRQFDFDRLATERIEAIQRALNSVLAPPYRWETLRMALRPVVVRLARAFGSPVVDARTGRALGRALLIPFRGKIHVVGLETPVVPVFLPQRRLTYWKQELGFTVHPPPDFPHEPPGA